MKPADIESLERAVVAAVAPSEVLEIDGWLVPLRNGAISRAKSAVPLAHDIDGSAVDAILAAYERRGLPPAFRIADIPAFDPLREALASRGLTGRQRTVMKVGDVARLAQSSDGPAEVLAEPNDAWSAVFLGEGFEPYDAADRIAALTRSVGALYGAAGDSGETRAVGVASFGYGWAGVHGMRTAPAHRRKGYATRVLAALGRAMARRGLTRAFLQVEVTNPARRIYRRAGFMQAWTYQYWR